MEFFRYLVDRLRAARRRAHPRVRRRRRHDHARRDRASSQAHGVARIFSPEDGRAPRARGHDPADRSTSARSRRARRRRAPSSRGSRRTRRVAVARLITLARGARREPASAASERAARARSTRGARGAPAPVVGFTGTGGAGKSSVVDEIVRRFRREHPGAHASACLLVDPTRRRTGGALLGDRIRMNAIHGPGIFVRSLATRQRAPRALARRRATRCAVLQAAGFDLILVETAGIGQSDSEIDRPRRHLGLRDDARVRRALAAREDRHARARRRRRAQQVRPPRRRGRAARRAQAVAPQSHGRSTRRDDERAGLRDRSRSRWNDPGIDRLYRGAARAARGARRRGSRAGARRRGRARTPTRARAGRARAAISPRSPRRCAAIARAADARGRARRATPGRSSARCAAGRSPPPTRSRAGGAGRRRTARCARYDAALADLEPELRARARAAGPTLRARYAAETQSYEVRGRAIRVENHAETLSRHAAAEGRAAAHARAGASSLRFLRRENLPGQLPVHRGRVPVQARERGPDAHVRRRGDARAHQPALPPAVAPGQPAARLSTAFDSVTLYGRDPDAAPRHLGQGRQLGRLGLHASTTPRSSTRASTCATRRPRSR